MVCRRTVETVPCGGSASRNVLPWSPLRGGTLWLLAALLKAELDLRSGEGTPETEGVREPCVTGLLPLHHPRVSPGNFGAL